jgi:hypothetical protein
MTSHDKELIDTADEQTLARWWCELNRYEAPEPFMDKEEIENLVDVPPKDWKLNTRLNSIMQYIQTKVEGKLLSRTWNKHMTDEEFDDFWQGCYCGDIEAKRRYDIRKVKKLAAKYEVDIDLLDLTKSHDEILEQLSQIVEAKEQ